MLLGLDDYQCYRGDSAKIKIVVHKRVDKNHTGLFSQDEMMIITINESLIFF